jgi:hypothetical protein
LGFGGFYENIEEIIPSLERLNEEPFFHLKLVTMMETPIQPSTRKKFLLWSLTTFGTATLLRFITGEKEKPILSTPIRPKNDTVKMLTKDGILVEIDRKHLVAADKNNDKISIDELKEWIKKQS